MNQISIFVRPVQGPFKASTVAYMLSGRYVSDYRSRHWSKSNPEGFCQLCVMGSYPSVLGTLEHLLVECPAIAATRTQSKYHWSDYLTDKPNLMPIISTYFDTGNMVNQQLQVQFLLDPASCPEVIESVQNFGIGVLSDILYLTRTWCYSHHLERQKLLRLYNII